MRGAPFVQPVHGAVGCSPAATAAWLSECTDHPSVDYLEAVQNRGGGPVPGVTPITFFERAWVLAALTSAGFSLATPHELTASLHDAVGESGASAAPGLPPDSDDTAAVLYVLTQLGRPRSPDSLLTYQVDAYFTCFSGERTPSTSTNAHVLQAFGACLEHDVSQRFYRQRIMGEISKWLGDCQESDGSWWGPPVNDPTPGVSRRSTPSSRAHRAARITSRSPCRHACTAPRGRLAATSGRMSE